MSDPLPISNLVKRVKRDGIKVYHAAGKAQLVAQVHEGQYSIPVLARTNAVNANLLHKWVRLSEAHANGTLVGSSNFRAAAALLPIKIVPSSAVGPEQIEVRCKHGSIWLAATPVNMSLLVQALSA